MNSLQAKALIPCMCLGLCVPATAQQTIPTRTRILFIIDASNSMNAPWGKNESKYQVAVRLLAQQLDSFLRTVKNLEVGVRLFGSDYPVRDSNCRDTRLLLPFGRYSREQILAALDTITPKGWTPIAYSLYMGMQDFSGLSPARNAIILITDGIETCRGDPCATVVELQRRRIAYKPFIIGMGVEDTLAEKLRCVGVFRNATNRSSYMEALNVFVSQALGTTTAQINLLDVVGQPTETNIPVTLVDEFTGEVKYHFVHSMVGGVPDTFVVDPTGRYTLIVHSIPSVVKRGIEFIAGTHNIVGVKVPQGSFTFRMERATPEVRVLILDSASREILFVQEMNTTVRYLSGIYDIEVLTTPPLLYDNIHLKPKENRTFTIPTPGTLIINPGSQYTVALFHLPKRAKPSLVKEWSSLTQGTSLLLLPGKYMLLYRPVHSYSTEESRTKLIEIKSKTTVRVDL